MLLCGKAFVNCGELLLLSLGTFKSTNTTTAGLRSIMLYPWYRGIYETGIKSLTSSSKPRELRP